MLNKPVNVKLSTLIVVVLLPLAASLVLGALLFQPANAPQAQAPAQAPTVLGAQAVNYFRQLAVKANEDATVISATGYTTQTNPLFNLTNSDGTSVFSVDNDGAVDGVNATFDTVTATTIVSQVVNLDAAGTITANNGIVGGLTGVVTATSATVGGGFGATGCTLSAAGVLQCDGAATIGGALLVTGTSTFQNAMTVNGNVDADSLSTAGNTDLTTINNSGDNPVTINDDLVITGSVTYSGTSQIPEDGGVITPTLTGYTLVPAGAVTVTLAACTTNQQTVLYNSENFDVIVQDTGNGILAGDQTLGQYDTLPLMCFDSKWVQTGPVSAN